MNLRVNINICRVCMKADSGVSLLEDNDLNEKFVFTTRLKPNVHDDMPSLICNKCQKRLRISYEFVKLAHESEKNLKAFLIKISKDFQLVTNKISSNNNEDNEDDDDDLLSMILDEENIEKKTSELEEISEKPISTQKGTATTSTSLLRSRSDVNFGKKAILKNQVNQENAVSTKPKRAGDDTGEISKADSSSCKRIKIDAEEVSKDKREYELMGPELRGGIDSEDVDNIPKYNIVKEEINLNELPNTETQNETTSEHEIQILDYTDEDDSQTELEILEEDTRSSLDVIEQPPPPSNDGFLKEYQTMLEEGDDYLEDNSAVENKEAVVNNMTLYDTTEEEMLEEDAELEMKTINTDTGFDTRAQVTTETKESLLKEEKPKSNSRSSAVKFTRKDESTGISKRYFCFKCNRDFSTKTNLTRHMVTHEGNRPFQCNVCNKSFSQNVTLKLHMYTHTGEKPYQCQVCHRGFTQCKSLVIHLRRHTGEKPFPCEKCGALFRQKDGLKKHILNRHTIKSHDGNTELITCSICKEDLVDNQTLQEHLKKHLSDYVRVDSALSFSNRETSTDDNNPMLLEYIDDNPLHDKDTVFLGETVSESVDDINTAAHVVDLMTTSALEPSRAKKFQCRKCFKCFAIKKSLLRHLTTHNINVSPETFICKVCEISFNSCENLRAHAFREHNSHEELY